MIDQEILNLRKKIYHNLKKKAYGYEELVSKDIKKYLKEQNVYASRKYRLSNFEDLVASLLKSHIVFLGDFHTFDQNIRNVLRLIKVALEKKRPCILALEMVNYEHQLYIDAYLEHHITELEFLESINYHESWRFPWTHYKIIFELAKKHNIRITGINTTGRLKERDQFAAEICNEIHKEFPDHILFVLYGELHITRSKIPALVHSLDADINSLIIHQNLDQVYWDLINKKSKSDIVKFARDEYCINSAPPWIKYESMVYWYENLCQDPEFDIHNYLIENGKKIFNDDTHEEFLNLCEQILDVVKLDIDRSDLDDFNLYDHTGLERVQDQVLEMDHTGIVNFFTYLITTSQSFRIPDSNTYYCSSYSMNRLAYIAGIHIFYHQLKINGDDPLKIYQNGTQPQKFIFFTYEAALGFFFSKIINPHRKCDMYKNLKTEFRHPKTSKDRYTSLEVALAALDNKDLKIALRNKRLIKLHDAAQLVGHILGEYLYYLVIEKKEKDYIQLFQKNLVINQENFKKFRHKLIGNINYKTHIKRFF